MKILINFAMNIKSIGRKRKEKNVIILHYGEAKNIIAVVEVGCLTRWKSKEGNGDAISRKRVHKFNLAAQVL